jgi:SagB-type dehydrogenase family enzyme
MTLRIRELNRVHYRRSPHFVCYWERGALVFENFATGARIRAQPLACEILHFFSRWRTCEALVRRLKEYSPASVARAVAALSEHSLLQRSDRPPTGVEQAFESWEAWNPAAGFFHFSTKDVQYSSDLQAVRRALRRRAQRWPVPSPVKRYARARHIALPPARTAGELPQVLLRRRTWRRFAPRPINLSQLATLLRLTWGVQRWVELPGLGRLSLKTSPSAGARHPIEAYVLALRVDGLPRGLYHYAADRHRLELLRRGGSSRTLVSYLAGQWWYGSAAALVLMTAVFPRNQWKYQFPRAYRAVLLDAGHVCQTFCLVATWLGLAPFCTAALADSVVEKALGIDGVTEGVLYAAGVGTPPPGMGWAPFPSRRRLPR